MTGHFYCEKFRRTCKELTNESENDRSLSIVKKYRRTWKNDQELLLLKSSIGPEKYRRTRKELTNESENDRSLSIVKKYRRTQKND